jgi:hypothetical protein
MKHVDYKMTIWGRIHFKEDTDMDKIIELLKQTDDINQTFDDDLGFNEHEVIYESGEYLPCIENDKQPTIEVYDETKSFSPIWNNAESI